MAEDEGATSFGEAPANGETAGPQVAVMTQYVKDLSFENPNAPAVYQWQTQPRIDVGFNLGAQQVGEDVHEVTLKIDVHAQAEDRTAFRVEVLYAGLFGIRNVPEEQMSPFLYAEAPRILFPFARQIVAEAVQNGGFPPLLLDPIDFAGAFMQQAAQAQAEATGGHAAIDNGTA
jgi:preprotein translocase subunit SecB